MNHDAFDWDFDNLHHIAQHSLAPEEVECVVLGELVFLRHEDHRGEIRFVEVGATATGRMLEVVTTIRGSRIRVVTAYDAGKDSVRQYFAGDGDDYAS